MKKSEYLNIKKEEALKNKSISGELSDFYMSIFLMQEEFELPADSSDLYDICIKKEGYPALASDDIIIDENSKIALTVILQKLTDIIQGMNPGMDFSLIKNNFGKDADNLLRALLNGDYDFLERKGRENNLAVEEFLFVLNKVFNPLMMALREKFFVKPAKDDWMENICPFCGYLPDMSKIVESKDNKRVLHCALCENEWEFPRMVCAACGCNDQAKNGFFEYEGNTDFRVYYCDECRHYIKSVRLPKLKEESSINLSVEDVITGFLDAGMMEKGYKRI